VDRVGGIVHLPRRKFTARHLSSEIVTMNMIRTAAAAFAILTASFIGAQAATESKDTPPPVAAEPQNTSATYGDWILRCSRNGNGAQAVRVCEVVQSFQIQGQQGVFAQLAIGRVGAKDPLRITLAMQPNVSFPSTVKLSVDEKDTQPVELSWRKCIPGGGCLADTEFKDDTLKRWKGEAGNGRLAFKDAAGRDIAIPFSFRGLAQALDGLVKS
jgi:invasion protein IalB